MLSIHYIREKKEEAIERLAVKNFDAREIIEQIISIDETRRKTQNEMDTLLNTSNQLAKQIGDLFKSGKTAEANDLKNKSGALKEETGVLKNRLEELEKELNDLLVKLPNTPHHSTPFLILPND